MSTARHVLLTATGVLIAIPIIDFIRWCQIGQPWVLALSFAVVLLTIIHGLRSMEKP